VRAGRTELPAVAERLLEVIADDRLVLRHAVAGVLLRPDGEPLVKLRAALLRQPRVRRVEDQDVMEPERVLAREGRTLRRDEPLAHQRLEMAPHVRTEALRAELGDRAPPELLPDHRGRAEDDALLGAEAVEPRGEQRLDRGG